VPCGQVQGVEARSDDGGGKVVAVHACEQAAVPDAVSFDVIRYRKAVDALGTGALYTMSSELHATTAALYASVARASCVAMNAEPT